MNTVGAFRQAILEDPLNDHLKLIYADWLEDNGAADEAGRIREDRWRGNHRTSLARRVMREIRVAASITGPVGLHINTEPGRRLCDQDMGPTLGRVGRRGRRPSPDHQENFPADAIEFLVRRGFVAEVRCFQSRFLDVAEKLFNHFPIVAVWLVSNWPREVGSSSVPRRYAWARLAETCGLPDPPIVGCDLSVEIFDQLDGAERLATPEGDFAYYGSDAQAVEAASRAAVQFGRAIVRARRPRRNRPRLEYEPFKESDHAPPRDPQGPVQRGEALEVPGATITDCSQRP